METVKEVQVRGFY